MLTRLKRQFIIIVMTLVGLVLTSVLGLSLISTWQNQQNLIQQALVHALEGELNSVPTIGLPTKNDGQSFNMLSAAVEVTSSGVTLQSSSYPSYFEKDALADVIQETLTSDKDMGYDRVHHVAWMKKSIELGYRIAMVDTSVADTSFDTLLMRYIELSVGSLLVLLAITWGLANWSLKPVAAAWEQQKRFLSDASHELKTPLAVISANTQILQKDSSLSPDAKRWVDSTVDEATQMKSLVNDLLTLARADESMSEGKQLIATEDVNFSDISSLAALEFDAIAFEKGSEIVTHITDDLHVMGNREQLDRLVRTLVDNACKYTAVGSAIQIVLVPDKAKRIKLTVNNHGSVIPKEDLPHLFDRFYRSDKARTHDGGAGGFGLGLAIAKSIVDTHGGTINATSDESAGTTFTVILPLIQQ